MDLLIGLFSFQSHREITQFENWNYKEYIYKRDS